MKKIIAILGLVLVTLLLPGKLTFASTDTDYISDIDIRPKNEKPLPGDDTLYYGYVDLDKSFRRDELNYTATVENEVKNVKFEVCTRGNVIVTGNKDYDLNEGENTITIVATTSDGSNKTYTFVINRLVSEDDNADLSNMFVCYNDKQFIEDFNPNITTYNVVVESEISEVEVFGITAAGTATIEGQKEKFKLKTGNNKIALTVTSLSGKKKTYEINIEKKKSSDVSLASLIVNGEDVGVDKKNISINVLYDTKTVDISAYVFDEAIQIDGIGIHKIKVGRNKIKLTVMAEDGTKDVYNLNVIRANPTTKLSDLQINGYNCGTNGSTLSFDVKNSTDKAEIEASPVDKSAKVTGNGTYNLKVGKNTFRITVKAANGKTKTYRIVINRSKYKDVNIIIIWN